MAFIALGLAIIMLPTLFKMIYEKPKLKVFYDSSKGYKLWCWIRNMPMNNKILIWMGVERRPQNISSTITISDENGAIIARLVYGTTSSKDIRRGIVEIRSKNDGRVFLKDEHDKFGTMLRVGLYTLVLELWDERKLLEERKHFQVNPNNPFVEWVVNK